jgi:hypothetical protein
MYNHSYFKCFLLLFQAEIYNLFRNFYESDRNIASSINVLFCQFLKDRIKPVRIYKRKFVLKINLIIKDYFSKKFFFHKIPIHILTFIQIIQTSKLILFRFFLYPTHSLVFNIRSMYIVTINVTYYIKNQLILAIYKNSVKIN